VIRARRFGRLALPYVAAGAAAAVALAGLIGVVESVYRLSDTLPGSTLVLAGIEADARRSPVWIAGFSLLTVGLLGLRFAARWVAARWGEVQQELKAA
jgi:hypothetical protein